MWCLKSRGVSNRILSRNSLSKNSLIHRCFGQSNNAAVENGRNDLILIKKVNGKPYASVPRLATYASFVDEQEETQLVEECFRLRSDFGFQTHKDLSIVSQGRSADTKIDSSTLDDPNLKIKSVRVTGRPEDSKQTPAPWGYAMHFDLLQLPTQLRHLVSKVSLWNSDLTPSHLRDITINYRTNSMFRIDPHVDPADDGGHVLVLSLLSDVVFTLSPEHALLMRDSTMSPVIRTAPATIELKSWSDEDVDVHLKRRAIVHLSGDARYDWKHGIRTGLQVGAPFNGICDFWGDLNSLIKRGPDRISVVLAYR